MTSRISAPRIVGALGLLLCAAAVAEAAPAAAPARAGSAIKRFLLVVDSSDGGRDRVRLRYTASDGKAVVRVLHELGGVGSDERITLHEADRTQLQHGFARMKEMVRAARSPGARIELVFYYSGHSDEDGLLVSGQRVGYDELRALIEQTGADVRIAILDSCASGALTRRKGGVRRPPFLVDTSTRARGHAFLTASSADEAAQESDRIGAAFFTHYLVSGLRGAADSSRDGRVTLNEAYQYAFAETLARTEKTSGGPQHPTYDIQLAGTGDLVMTDLRGTSSSLMFAERIAGRLFVRDRDGRLVAELRKTAASPIELGLEPGQYQITLEGEQKLWTADVELRAGGRTNLAETQLRPLAPMVATARGNAPPAGAGAAGEIAATPPTVDVTTSAAAQAPRYRLVPVNLSLIPQLSINGSGSQDKTINNFAFGVITHSDVLRGLQLSLGANLISEQMTGAQMAVAFNMVGGPAKGLQASAGVNFAAKDFVGAQMAPGVNVVGGHMRGLQAVAGVNIVRNGLVGLQAAAGVNVATGRVRGMQSAAGLSFAQELHGLQLSVINVGGDVHGAQIGVINVARRVRGLQLGVINVADDVEGAPIGVLSFVRKGYLHLEAFSSDTAAANLGVKMGGRKVYSVIAVGLHRPDTARGASAATAGEGWNYSGGLGIGGHIAINDRLYVDTDLMGWGYEQFSGNDDTAVLGTLRAVFGWQLAPALAFFAGPTYNVLTSWAGKDLAFNTGFAERVIHDGTVTVRMYPGIVLGVRI